MNEANMKKAERLKHQKQQDDKEGAQQNTNERTQERRDGRN